MSNLLRPAMFLLAVPLWATVTVYAQDNAAGSLEIATVEGKFEAAAGDRIKVKGEDGASYYALLGPKSSVQYRGTADARFLRPGFMVRFNATFDIRRGIALTPVSEIELFRPARQKRMSREQRLDQTPGIFPVTKKQEGDKGKSAPQTGSQGLAGAAASQELRVVGQLQLIQANKMRVMAGNRAVLVDLAQDPKISVAAGDVFFCQPGDAVKVTGLRNPAQELLLQVDTIEIAASQPLGSVGLPANANASDDNQAQGKRRGKLGDDD